MPRSPLEARDVTPGSDDPEVLPDTAPGIKYIDFWPACLHAEEGFDNATFERFE